MSLILTDMQASQGKPRDATQQQLSKLREQLNQSLYLFSTAIMGFDLLEPAFHGDLCRYIELWGTLNYRRVITQMPRGSFKCQRVGALVHTPSGPQLIESLRPGDEVCSLSESLTPTTHRVVSTRLAEADLIRLRLGTGVTLEVTPNHPLRTVLGWREAKDLQVGEGIAAPRSIPRPSPVGLYPYTSGALTGDGCAGGYTITGLDGEIFDAIRDEGVVLKPRKATEKHCPTYGVPKCFWHPELLHGAWEKFIPADYEGSAQFLSGLYDTDGTVSKDSRSIILNTVSARLAQDVQRNLRYFGITSRRRQHKTSGPNGYRGTCWFVESSGSENGRRFQKSIGFKVARKAQRLQELIDREDYRSASRLECVPPQWKTLLKRQPVGRRGGWGDLRKLAEAGLRCDNHYWTNLSKLREAGRILDRRDIETLGSENIIWEEVISIEPIGVGQIIELEVDGEHTYIADCVLHHNSSIGTQGNALWQICRQPDQPVAIINETEDKPKRWLRGIRHVVESSELFHVVYRDLIPQGVAKDDKRSTPQGVSWNDTCLDFNGRRPADPENSISGYGLGNALTGHHWPKMIMDDLVSVKHQQSPVEMQRVKEWALTHTKLMRPTDSGMAYVNCTPWTIDDVYVDFTQLYGYALYRRHALEGPNGEPDLDGTPVLSFFDKKTLLDSAHKSQEAMATWYSQMMCIPLPGGEQALHPSWLRWYTVEDDHVYIDPGSYVPGAPPQRIHLSKLHKAIFFDPAAAESAERKQSPQSRHGIVVVGIDAWGRKFILETIAMRDTPQRTINTIFNAARNWDAGLIFIESVNAQILWKHWILEKQQPGREWSGVRLTVREVLPGRADKNKRILDKAVEFETGRVFLNRVGCSEFQREYLEWHPNAANRDLLDAFGYVGHLLRPASDEEEQRWNVHPRTRSDDGRDEITGY